MVCTAVFKLGVDSCRSAWCSGPEMRPLRVPASAWDDANDFYASYFHGSCAT